MISLSRLSPRLFGIVFVALGCIGTSSANAQATDLRIRLNTRAGEPLAGALVALIGAGDSAIAEGLTDTAGTRILRAPAGTYRVRVRRIGFLPFVSQAVTLPRRGEFALQLDEQRVALRSIVVTANTRCGKFQKEDSGLAVVWDEITKALRAGQLTRSDLRSLARVRIYRKELDRGGEVLSSDTAYLNIEDSKPFGAPDPAVLAERGYVTGDENVGWQYFGVDESVLLSPEFAATHCFQLVRSPDRPAQIGMAFQPIPGRTTPDVTGVLWLDETTSELREVHFRFTNAGVLSRFDVEGYTKFRRLTSGAWVVDEWRLRAPRLLIYPGARDMFDVGGYVEDGGGIVASSIPAWAGRIVGTVRGVVFDSLALAPLAGATVTIGATSAASDSAGRVTFLNVPLEPQTIAFSHPVLSSLGYLSIEREINVVSDTTDVLLATPSYRTVWRRVCGDTLAAGDVKWNETGILRGTVHDSLGNPVPDAAVTLEWSEQSLILKPGISPTIMRQVVNTRADGRYAACGLPNNIRGSAVATVNGAKSEPKEFTFAGAKVERRDLTFSRKAIVAGSPFHEVIVTVESDDGRPLSDATVSVEGGTAISSTDDAGVAGLRTTEQQPVIRVRRIGYSERALKVVLAGARQRLNVILTPVQVLATVPVVAEAPLTPELERRRQQGGLGTFFGPEDIARVIEIKNLVTRAPGVVISGTTGRFVYSFSDRKGSLCLADVYIDGVHFDADARAGAPADPATIGDYLNSIPPDEVAAVEVYPHVGEAPQNVVRLLDGCGVILVWTKSWVREHSPEHR